MNIKKDIIYFDVETTGLDITTDKIIEIFALKVKVDGTSEKLYHLINPEKEVSIDAYKAHGYTLEMLSEYPTFNQVSDEIFSFFRNCDLAGYNIIKFDIPMLTEELLNSGKAFNPFKVNIVDGFKIITHFESYKLGDVYERYFGEELENAHSAEYDVLATKKVIEKQCELYDLSDPKIINTLLRSNDKGHNYLDFNGTFYEYKGDYYYGVGKHKNEKVCDHKDYLNWLLTKSNYPKGVKMVGRLIESNISQ